MSGLKRIVTTRRHHAPDPSPPPPTPLLHHPKPPAAANAFVRRFTRRHSPHTPAPLVNEHTTHLPSPLASPHISQPHSTTSPTLPLSHAPSTLTPFRLATLSIAPQVNLFSLLQKSPRTVTIKKAHAERYSVITAMENERKPDVLILVLERYAPYALTCWDIAENLKAQAAIIPSGIIWSSGLTHPDLASQTFDAGLALEASFILTALAVSKIRQVVETHRNFANCPEQHLVTQIKALQAAAGIFEYLRDTLTPAALADFRGTPPPEIFPETPAMMFSLSLCLAQALHVRRAVLNGMSSALLSKLSAAAAEYAHEAIAKFDNLIAAGVSLCPTIKTAAHDMLTLSQGWLFQYLGFTITPQQDAGGKVRALQAAIHDLEKASHSRMVGNVAALDLDKLKQHLADAEGENRIGYQQAIPHRDQIPLPAARSLVNPTPYDALRVPKAEKSADSTNPS